MNLISRKFFLKLIFIKLDEILYHTIVVNTSDKYTLRMSFEKKKRKRMKRKKLFWLFVKSNTP